MRRPQEGQSAAEFLLCVAVLAGVLFVPFIEGASVSTLLARRMKDFVHGFYALLALA